MALPVLETPAEVDSTIVCVLPPTTVNAVPATPVVLMSATVAFTSPAVVALPIVIAAPPVVTPESDAVTSLPPDTANAAAVITPTAVTLVVTGAVIACDPATLNRTQFCKIV